MNHGMWARSPRPGAFRRRMEAICGLFISCSRHCAILHANYGQDAGPHNLLHGSIYASALYFIRSAALTAPIDLIDRGRRGAAAPVRPEGI